MNANDLNLLLSTQKSDMQLEQKMLKKYKKQDNWIVKMRKASNQTTTTNTDYNTDAIKIKDLLGQARLDTQESVLYSTLNTSPSRPTGLSCDPSSVASQTF